MSFDDYGANLDLASFERLLAKDDIIEEPIPIEKFATDKGYLGLANGLSEIQLELARHMTQIFTLPTLFQLHGEEKGLEIYEKYTVNEIVAMCGKGSGKDYSSRISFLYLMYLFHCMRDPLEYYNKDFGTNICLLNLAVNSQQAHQVFFEPLKNIMGNSQYFSDRTTYEPRVREINFFSRPVICLSGHSEAEGWEGYDLHTVVLDEISAFKTKAEIQTDSARAKGSADIIYNMAKFSVMSRFPEIGKVVLLSFPRFQNDFITTKYAEAQNLIGEKVWALKAATYEMNPSITRESLESEYRRNPAEAKGRFQCEPPMMEDSYFREPERVRAAFYYGDDPMNDDGTWKPWFNGTDGFPRFLHVDLGLKRDRCGLVMVHASGMKQVETMGGAIESLPIINVDFIHSWKAGINEEINFASVRKMIFELARKFPVALVSTDHWNSADLVQSLRAENISTDVFVVKRPAYETLTTTIYDGRLRAYWNEILVEEELLRLKLINNVKVDHGSSGSKDIADALAGSVWMCFKHFDAQQEMEIEIWDNSMEAEIEEDFFMAKEEKIDREVWKPHREVPQELEDWLIESL